MNLSDTLKLISIVVAIIFGLTRIWVVIRHRYQVEITFLLDESISLYDRVVKNISDLKIFYLDKPIKENIILIKGYIIHTGTKDITPDMIEEKLSIQLSENSLWHNITIVKHSANLLITSEIDPLRRVIIFTQGLFKRNEFFYFEALVETNTQFRLGKDIIFSHRISDAGKVKIVDSIKYKNASSILTNILGFLFCSSLLFSFIQSEFLSPPYVTTHIENPDKTVILPVTHRDSMGQRIYTFNHIYDTMRNQIDSLRKLYTRNHIKLNNLWGNDTAICKSSNGLLIKIYPSRIVPRPTQYFFDCFLFIGLILLDARFIINGIKKLEYYRLTSIVATGEDRKPLWKEIILALVNILRSAWPSH